MFGIPFSVYVNFERERERKRERVRIRESSKFLPVSTKLLSVELEAAVLHFLSFSVSRSHGGEGEDDIEGSERNRGVSLAE